MENNLKVQINERLTQAMRDKNVEVLATMRSIVTKITEAEKKNGSIITSNDEIIKIIEKLSKQREESILLYKKGNRLDLAKVEQFELDILKEYLPTKMTELEIIEAVDKAILAGVNNIGSLMKELNQYGSLIDKKLASKIYTDKTK